MLSSSDHHALIERLSRDLVDTTVGAGHPVVEALEALASLNATMLMLFFQRAGVPDEFVVDGLSGQVLDRLKLMRKVAAREAAAAKPADA